MDAIKFIIEDYVDDENGFRFPTINIYINANNLIELVERVEQRNQILHGEKPYHSLYIGFEPIRYRDLRNELLGLQKRPFSILLTCTCTIAECNCIMAKIELDSQRVTWSELKSPWLAGNTPSAWVSAQEAQEGGWIPFDYSGLSPFVFDKTQYMDALNKLMKGN